MPKNKLVVQQSEQLVNQFKEEMAEEFGMYRSVAESEAITPKIIKKQKNEKNK
ncbi:small, acid-soluble spore protein, alpha/beta type [Fictibacillus sp. 23RED33]|uniref:small, acid-soluble spore protein, alpha/beta type n=1 Tax=Fictibacillus sp. 23RED33 TaxID=2745879 RepID=UPI0018CF0106|nr:small, acid-soluble spore protein, alpha/beta type [Fictibacillus sp. 23RED33]MBH0173059.1 small, acid-soluble spore protein, alpha/beta type [Fictibacillus sp. 23RED33]